MDKKEAKKQYLKMRLEDPAVPEWEKKEIRQRLGVDTIVSENDFTIQATDELLHFVYNYLEAQLSALLGFRTCCTGDRNSDKRFYYGQYPRTHRVAKYIIIK